MLLHGLYALFTLISSVYAHLGAEFKIIIQGLPEPKNYDVDIPPFEYYPESISWAVGITKNCLVYEYIDRVAWSYDSISLRNRNCTEYKVFLMQYEDSYNVTTTIGLAIRVVGPRLEIQNAFSGKRVFESDSGSAYIFKPKYRETFLTNALPPGYMFQQLFHVGYRVYVLVRTKSDLRIHQLKLILQDVNTPKFYLTSPVRIDPVLFPPSSKTKVHVFDASPYVEMFNHTSVYTPLLKKVLSCRERYKPKNTIEAIVLYLENSGSFFESLGSLFLMSSIRRSKPYYHYLSRVPMPTSRHDGMYCKLQSLEQVINWNPEEIRINETRMNVYYLMQSSFNDSEPIGGKPRPLFKKKLFNPFNFHSRMAYPHAIFYNPLFNRNLLAPTKNTLLPLFIGSCLGIFLLSKTTFIVLKCILVPIFAFRSSKNND